MNSKLAIALMKADVTKIPHTELVAALSECSESDLLDLIERFCVEGSESKARELPDLFKREASPDELAFDEWAERVVSLLRNERSPIPAIKAMREGTVRGVGLIEAKYAIENIRSRVPSKVLCGDFCGVTPVVTRELRPIVERVVDRLARLSDVF